jgi:hypothetical protein
LFSVSAERCSRIDPTDFLILTTRKLIMHRFTLKKFAVAGSLIAAGILPAHAGLLITEVHPSGSGNGNYAADWFELTNTGVLALNIAGWQMDDNSNGSAKVALRGVTSIGAGQSIVFFEGNSTGTTDLAIAASFNTAWGTSFAFGNTIGAYGGSGVGLSTAGDAVNLFDAGGTRITGVSFGAATAGVTFDNAAGLGGTVLPLPAIAVLSVGGINGAYISSINETGSPGVITAAVPEPETYAMMLAGLGLLGFAARRRKQEESVVA